MQRENFFIPALPLHVILVKYFRLVSSIKVKLLAILATMRTSSLNYQAD